MRVSNSCLITRIFGLTVAAAFAGFFAQSVSICLGQILNENLKILPSDGAADDLFGAPIFMRNGVVGVGAILDDDNGTDSGSAYLFDARTGQQLLKLLPSDGTQGDNFGFSIAIDNGVVAVGAQGDDDNGTDSGSAYLFDASTGQQLLKLLPSDGSQSDNFGTSIAIDNGVVAAGAYRDDDNGSISGSAYLFDASTGQQLHKLLPSDGEAGDLFGVRIAIDNGVAAVAAILDDDNGTGSGSAYLFDASTGQQLHKLLPSDGEAGDQFGARIAIDNGVVAVGAEFDDDNGTDSGSAYLFDASTGQQLLKLLPSDGEAGDRFGGAVFLRNGVVGVGAQGDDDNGTDSGSAYLFDASTGQQLLKLLPSDGSQSDNFGTSIAIDNGVVAVGAWLDDDNGTDSGSAYIFCVSSATANIVIADQYNIYRGLQISGDLADSFESDDSYLKFNPGFTVNSSEAPVWLIFDGTLPSDNPASLEIVMESNVGTPGLTHTLEAWNWTSMAYDVFDVSPASFNEDIVVTLNLKDGISDYVESGTGVVRTRVGWRKTGFTINYPWEVRLDQLVWIVTE